MHSFWALVDVAESIESPDEDIVAWLSTQAWVPWAMLVGFGGVGLWMVRSLLHHRGRERRIERVAAAAGMDYREQDGFGLSKVRFAHMLRGEGNGWLAGHVVTMTARDDARVHAFDIRSWTEVVVSERDEPDRTVRSFTGATRTGAMAPLPVDAPRLVIARENMASRVFAAATRLDLDVESEAFNRTYHVIGEDRRFARAVLDARMIDLMVSTEGKITFEFFGRWLLLHTEQLDPDLMPGLVRLADEMRRVMPRLVVDGWAHAPRVTHPT